MPNVPSRQRQVTETEKALALLSLDAGGSRAVSQLKTLTDIMHGLYMKDDQGKPLETYKPCAVFDAIAGIGSGGFIAILLVIFGLSAEEASNTFVKVGQDVLSNTALNAEMRTQKLRSTIVTLLKDHGFDEYSKLNARNERSQGCKLIIPIVHKFNTNTMAKLRNYNTPNELPLNMSILDAILTTLATPFFLVPTGSGGNHTAQQYVSGDTILGNPIRELLEEAYTCFGRERHVACLLSLGPGHGGVNPVFTDEKASSKLEFLERIVTDGERIAQQIGRSMNDLSLYHRFSVTHGLEEVDMRDWSQIKLIGTRTISYLEDNQIQERMDGCIESLRSPETTTTLERLRFAGGPAAFTSAVPVLPPYFVELAKAPGVPVDRVVNDNESNGRFNQDTMITPGIGQNGNTQTVFGYLSFSLLFLPILFLLFGGKEGQHLGYFGSTR